MKKLIDISRYNTISSWKKVKENIDGVIIRCAYRGYGSGTIVADSKYQEYAEQCRAHGIPFGIYFMSQAVTAEEGREEAEYAVTCDDEFGASLPLFIDSEDGDGSAKVVRADGLSKRQRTDVINAFCVRAGELGKTAGVYASESWFQDRLYYDELKQYLIWCAKYGSNNGVAGTKPKWQKVDIWQYTSKGTVPGISGNVDLNISYIDETAAGQQEEETVDDLIKEIITVAGLIQNKVNALLKE